MERRGRMRTSRDALMVGFTLNTPNLISKLHEENDHEGRMTLHLDGDELTAALWGLANYRKPQMRYVLVHLPFQDILGKVKKNGSFKRNGPWSYLTLEELTEAWLRIPPLGRLFIRPAKIHPNKLGFELFDLDV